MSKKGLLSVDILSEMREAYIDYSMSVIVSRAIPDVRDGLKPVHRRVIYGMYELGVSSGRPYKKSARIVGEVLGKYHPHGDTSVYDSMVRMAQEWSMRYPLVDGQGNFGSVDGDSPAAMRYTEARLFPISQELIDDISKETVDFQPNFDDTLKEPMVLPSRLPHLLLNGSSGIAVGMATNIPPHNIREIVEATCQYIDGLISDSPLDVSALMRVVKAPDFPTGGIIYGVDGFKQAYETGRGRMVIRGKADIEMNSRERACIVVSELPYMVNKAAMIEKTAILVQSKKIEGISDIRDESDRDGMRIVYELKKDAVAQVVLNNLYKHTSLQSTFGVNCVALVHGRPRLLNLEEMIRYYVEHRHEVVLRRLAFEKKKAEDRLHILEGYLKALDDLDSLIALIRASRDTDHAREELMLRFDFSQAQSQAILELRLQRLTALERDKIEKEHKELQSLLKRITRILSDRSLQFLEIKKELEGVLERYGDERRTSIEHNDEDIRIEDVIPNQRMVITISHFGYIKRTPVSLYRAQARGGVGAKGVQLKDEDFTAHFFIATNHNYLLIFTEKGRVYWLRVYEIPEGKRTAQGRSILQLLQLDSDDKIRAILNVSSLSDEKASSSYVLMATTQGLLKKTALSSYARPRKNGIQAIRIREGDSLLGVSLTGGDSEVLLASRKGMAIRLQEKEIRSVGRVASGVIGMRLSKDKGDKVVGMVCLTPASSWLLVLSEKGYGKRSRVSSYPLRP